MAISYYALLPDGPDSVLVLSLSSGHVGLRVEKTELRFGSLAQVKQELSEPPADFLEFNAECTVLWHADELSFQVWSGAGSYQPAGCSERRIKTRFRSCLRVESNRVEVFSAGGRTRTLAKRDLEAVVSWSRVAQAIGGVSLIPIGARRVRICWAFNMIAVGLLTDTAPDLWEESWEGLDWTARLGSALASRLGVPWIDEVERSDGAGQEER